MMMKTTLIIIIIFASLNSFSQNFAPIGAKWYYSVLPPWSWPNDEYYMTVDVTKDSIINGKLFTEVKPSYVFCAGYNFNSAWIYNEDNIVYFYDTTMNTLQILYNFNASANDSWSIKYRTYNENIDSLKVVVDSTRIQIINSIPLKVLNVRYISLNDTSFSYSSQIIERIGDLWYLFNFVYHMASCDTDYPGGLRCYNDSIFGSYSTGIAPSCTYVHTKIDDNPNNQKTQFSIFYNLSNNKFNVNATTDNRCVIVLFNEIGQIIKEFNFQKQLEFNINDLRSGLYFAKIINTENNYFEVKKIIKTI